MRRRKELRERSESQNVPSSATPLRLEFASQPESEYKSAKIPQLWRRSNAGEVLCQAFNRSIVRISPSAAKFHVENNHRACWRPQTFSAHVILPPQVNAKVKKIELRLAYRPGSRHSVQKTWTRIRKLRRRTACREFRK